VIFLQLPQHNRHFPPHTQRQSIAFCEQLHDAASSWQIVLTDHIVFIG
jgi:hypothetical protein